MAGEVLQWVPPLCNGQRQSPWIWRPGQICRGLALARQRRVMGPVWAGRWSFTSSLTTPWVYMARVHLDPVSSDIRVVLLPVKITPTSAMVDEDGVSDVVPLLMHCCCKLRKYDRDALGETLDLGLLDQTMTTLWYRFPRGRIVGVDWRGQKDRCYLADDGTWRHGAAECR